MSDSDFASEEYTADTRLIELQWEEVLGRLRAQHSAGYADQESLRAATQELLSISASIRTMAKMTLRRSQTLRA